MRRTRTNTEANETDAAVSAELAAAERSIRRALAVLDGRRRAASGDFDARRAVARVRRDLERCVEALRSVRLVGTVGGGTPEAPPVARRTPVPTEVAE